MGSGEPAMPSDCCTRVKTYSPARLLIHADGSATIGGAIFAFSLQRLCSSALDALRRRPPLPTGVRVDDLRGQQFFAAADVRAPIDVPLPAGTYHVDVRLGELRRCYTVTLEQGTTFDLYLRPLKDQP
jgi:hypothetical protein